MQVTINENYTFSCRLVHRTCEFMYIGEEPPSVEYGSDSRDCVSLPADSVGKETWPAANIGIRGSFAVRGPTIDHRIIMAGMAVFLRGWLPHRGKAQMACNYCFPTRTMF